MTDQSNVLTAYLHALVQAVHLIEHQKADEEADLLMNSDINDNHSFLRRSEPIPSAFRNFPRVSGPSQWLCFLVIDHHVKMSLLNQYFLSHRFSSVGWAGDHMPYGWQRTAFKTKESESFSCNTNANCKSQSKLPDSFCLQQQSETRCLIWLV